MYRIKLLYVQGHSSPFFFFLTKAELIPQVETDALIVAIPVAKGGDSPLVERKTRDHSAEYIRGVEGHIEFFIEEGLVQTYIELAKGIELVKILLATQQHKTAQSELGFPTEGELMEGKEAPATAGKGQGAVFVQPLIFREVVLGPNDKKVLPSRWDCANHTKVGFLVGAHIIKSAHGDIFQLWILIYYRGENAAGQVAPYGENRSFVETDIGFVIVGKLWLQSGVSGFIEKLVNIADVRVQVLVAWPVDSAAEDQKTA